MSAEPGPVPAAPAWKPVDSVDPVRLCKAPRCEREFRPSKPDQEFCSQRCADAAAVVAGAGVARVEPASDGPRCAYSMCNQPFTPSKTGWTARYHSLKCSQAAKAEREAAAMAAPGAAPDPSAPGPQPERIPDPVPAILEEVVASSPPTGGIVWPPKPPDSAPETPAGPPDPEPALAAHMSGYAVGHADGFCSGVEAGAELAMTLMASPTFRALAPDTIRAVICEALS